MTAMFITRKAIPRRTVLRGMGAVIALPFLESMVPALGATPEPLKRFSIVFAPNGMNMQQWTPRNDGASYELSPTLEPLKNIKDRFLVISGLNNTIGDPMPGEGESAPHERAGAVFLTGVHPQREGRVGISVDQIAARELGKRTQLASLELGLHANDVLGQCEKGWSCAYLNTISWRTPSTPLPIEYRPRAVFERLFGDNDSTDPTLRRARLSGDRSLLDSVSQAAANLMNRVGPSDRARLSEYIDGMRDVERRIQLAEEQSGRELPTVERPAGIPARFEEHAKLMFDLQTLALQSDLTRVMTFMMGPEQSNRAFPEIGVPDVHHGISHHQSDPEKLEKLYKVNVYHMQLLAYYLNKLKDTPEGAGTLLDQTLVMFACSMSDSNDHLLQNLPVVLAGGRPEQVKHGLHMRVPDATPISNLYWTLLEKLGVPLENFGNSEAKFGRISLA
jgi:hypothetical protein